MSDRAEGPSEYDAGAARVDNRANLLPEEQAAGSDDSHRQAEIILEDSDARTEHPEQTKRDSTQTPD